MGGGKEGLQAKMRAGARGLMRMTGAAPSALDGPSSWPRWSNRQGTPTTLIFNGQRRRSSWKVILRVERCRRAEIDLEVRVRVE